MLGNGLELSDQERGPWGIAPTLLTWATKWKVETILRERENTKERGCLTSKRMPLFHFAF